MARNALSAVLGLACCVWTASSARGADPLVPFNPATASFNEAHGNAMVGWTFHVNSTVRISQIGWYDENHDGLSRAMQVGLWQDLSGNYFGTGSTPTSLVGPNGIIIPGGSEAELNGDYRVVNLSAPIDLVPGDYELGGLDSASTSDVIKYKMIVGNEYPGLPITIRQFFYAFTSDPGFHVTGNFYLADGLEIGPMVFTVPEPTGLACITLAATSLFGSRRTRVVCRNN